MLVSGFRLCCICEASSPPVLPSQAVANSPSTGDLNAGNTVTLTLNLSEAVTVAGGTPTLTLNDGGTATYTGGSGTSALTFSYTVGAGTEHGIAGCDRDQPQRRDDAGQRRAMPPTFAELA